MHHIHPHFRLQFGHRRWRGGLSAGRAAAECLRYSTRLHSLFSHGRHHCRRAGRAPFPSPSALWALQQCPQPP